MKSMILTTVLVLLFTGGCSSCGFTCGPRHSNYDQELPTESSLDIGYFNSNCFGYIVVIPIPILDKSYPGVDPSYVDGHNGLFDHSFDYYEGKDGFYKCQQELLDINYYQLRQLALENVENGVYNDMFANITSWPSPTHDAKKRTLRIRAAIKGHDYICFTNQYRPVWLVVMVVVIAVLFYSLLVAADAADHKEIHLHVHLPATAKSWPKPCPGELSTLLKSVKCEI